MYTKDDVNNHRPENAHLKQFPCLRKTQKISLSKENSDVFIELKLNQTVNGPAGLSVTVNLKKKKTKLKSFI